jgi:hypothetical protein
MDFGRFSPNFIEFGRFFQKPAGSEGADFLVSAGFLNTAPASILITVWHAAPITYTS